MNNRHNVNSTHNMEKIAAILFVLFIIPFSPDPAPADAGAPLLLLVNGVTFLFGFVLILALETYICIKLSGLPFKTAFGDMGLANLGSTILIGLGVPLLVAAVSVILGSMVEKPGVGEKIMAVGSWITSRTANSSIALWAAGFWFLATFAITVYFESWVLNRRWKRREFSPSTTPRRLSWIANSLSYLLIGAMAVFGLLFFD